jgi:predicted regulator of Ras-like GTPase activity (Roadblock/LC7/MglB family)
MKEILAEMANGLAGTWMIIVADNDGMLLSSWESPENKLPPELMGQFILAINGAITAFSASTSGFGKLDDVIYSTAFSYQVIKPIADGACFMLVNAPKTVPLGMIRMSCHNYTPRLEAALPGNQPLPRRDGMGTAVS